MSIEVTLLSSNIGVGTFWIEGRPTPFIQFKFMLQYRVVCSYISAFIISITLIQSVGKFLKIVYFNWVVSINVSSLFRRSLIKALLNVTKSLHRIIKGSLSFPLE